jgi:hypothetical protein
MVTDIRTALQSIESMRPLLDEPGELDRLLRQLDQVEPSWVVWVRAARGVSRAGISLQLLAEATAPQLETTDLSSIEAEDIYYAWWAVAMAYEPAGGGPRIGTAQNRDRLLVWLMQIAVKLGYMHTLRELHDMTWAQIAAGAEAPGKKRHELTSDDLGRAEYKGGTNLYEQTHTHNFLAIAPLLDRYVQWASEPTIIAPGEYPCDGCGRLRHHSQELCYYCGRP